MGEQTQDRELDKIEIKFKHLKQKEIEFIISKYNQGYSIREIAKLLNKKSNDTNKPRLDNNWHIFPNKYFRRDLHD